MQLNLTQLGAQMSQRTGVRAIMQDIIETLRAGSSQTFINLSAGNPVILPAVEQLWRDCTAELLASPEYGEVVCRYGSSQGYAPLIDAIARDSNQRYSLRLSDRNILPLVRRPSTSTPEMPLAVGLPTAATLPNSPKPSTRERTSTNCAGRVRPRSPPGNKRRIFTATSAMPKAYSAASSIRLTVCCGIVVGARRLQRRLRAGHASAGLVAVQWRRSR